MEKINIDTFSQNIVDTDSSGMTIGYHNDGLNIVAEKLNEIIDWINEHAELPDPNYE